MILHHVGSVTVVFVIVRVLGLVVIVSVTSGAAHPLLVHTTQNVPFHETSIDAVVAPLLHT